MATTTGIVSSSADSFSSSLDADGFTTTVSPFAPVSGVAPPAYDHTKPVAAFDHLYDLTPAISNELSLEMQAAHMVNNASSAGIGVDSIGASGAANLGRCQRVERMTRSSAGAGLGDGVGHVASSRKSSSERSAEEAPGTQWRANAPRAASSRAIRRAQRKS